MENNNDENIQSADEQKTLTETQLTEIEAETISTLTSTNGANQTSNQNLEEEEKANEDQTLVQNTEVITTNNEEIKSVSSSSSKENSQGVSPKITPRSNNPTAVKQDVRAYLEEKVFPVLTKGLEELLKAVDERNKKLNEEEEEDIPEIHPLHFLARYLMRNAPQHSRASSQHSQERSSGKDDTPPKEVPSAPNEEVASQEKSEEEKPPTDV